MSNSVDTIQSALAESWLEQFGTVMELMSESRPQTAVLGVAASETGNELWWKQPLTVAPGAAMWVGAPAETWNGLGRAILAASGIENAEPDDAKDSYLEVVRQAFGGLARLLTAQIGREVTCPPGSEEPPAKGSGLLLGLTANGQALPALGLRCNRELLNALAPATAEGGEDNAELPARASRTLDLLLDVEMPVSVSFGRTRVRMQEVLKLITGSIIELDRAVSEPVEVMVNNCVIARGMVVVVDGNYGVRVDEVMSRRERLEQSRKYLAPVHAQRR